MEAAQRFEVARIGRATAPRVGVIEGFGVVEGFWVVDGRAEEVGFSNIS